MWAQSGGDGVRAVHAQQAVDALCPVRVPVVDMSAPRRPPSEGAPISIASTVAAAVSNTSSELLMTTAAPPPTRSSVSLGLSGAGEEADHHLRAEIDALGGQLTILRHRLQSRDIDMARMRKVLCQELAYAADEDYHLLVTGLSRRSPICLASAASWRRIKEHEADRLSKLVFDAQRLMVDDGGVAVQEEEGDAAARPSNTAADAASLKPGAPNGTSAQDM